MDVPILMPMLLPLATSMAAAPPTMSRTSCQRASRRERTMALAGTPVVHASRRPPVKPRTSTTCPHKMLLKRRSTKQKTTTLTSYLFRFMK